MRLTSPRRMRTAARGLPVIVLVLLATLAAAPTAAAHHASVKASASCVDGQYVIDWRALSWVATDGTTDNGRTAEPWRGLNQKPGITISYRLGWHGHAKKVVGVYTLTAAKTTGVVVKGKTRQFPSASGSFDLPGTTKGHLMLRVKAGPWGPDPKNGHYVDHPWSRTGYLASVDLEGDCRNGNPPPPTPTPPAEPGATAASACVGTAAVIRVGLTNGNVAGGDPFAFTVSSPATGSKPSFSQTVTVAAHGESSVDVPVDENGSRTVTAGGTGFSQPFTRTGDCVADPQPNASADQVCTAGAGVIRLTLTNTNAANGESVTFTATSPATGSQPAYSMSITLNGGDVRHLDVPVDEDTARTVTVSAPGMSTVSFTKTIDCDSPAQPVAWAFSFCDGTVGNIDMNVANQNAPGGASVTFTIDLAAAGSQSALHQVVVVPAGGSQEVIAIADEGTTRAGTISAPGMTTLVFALGADCI